jgi:hypothetical protein
MKSPTSNKSKEEEQAESGQKKKKSTRSEVGLLGFATIKSRVFSL